MILVTGPTGNIGRHLVDELVRSGVRIRALVHGAEYARELSDRGVDVVVGSFEDRAALDRALTGVERLFLLSPPGVEQMIEQQTAVVDRAAAAGVAHVVKQSSIAADEDTEAAIIRAHRRIEEHIERSGLRWTHLRPNWFMQNELAQADSIAADGLFFAPDVTRVSMIDARDVAAVAARVLTGEGHEGRAYVLTGPESLSYQDVADRYSRVLGRPVRWSEVTFERARESMLEAGLPEVLASGFTQVLARYRDGGITATTSPEVERLVGRPPHTFEEFLVEHRRQFQEHERPAARRR
jgi:uncharacterized protein YbjT (DUF2867 family)